MVNPQVSTFSILFENNSGHRKKTQGQNQKTQVSAILKFFDIRKSGQKKSLYIDTVALASPVQIGRLF